MRGLVSIALVFAACGGDQAYKLENGQYASTTTEIAEDACNVAGQLGMTNNNYGRLSVTDQQVTHTGSFTSDIYMRSGNSLTRPMVSMDQAAGGPMNDCLLTDTIQESGSISGDDIVTITRHESHVIKSGNCTNVLRTMCMSTFTYKLTRLGP